LHVRQYRTGAEMLDHRRRGGERHRRGDDLVAGADSHRLERKMQRGRARVHGERVASARELGELTLELLDLLARGQPAGAKAMHDLVDLLLPEEGLREWKEIASHADPLGRPVRVRLD